MVRRKLKPTKHRCRIIRIRCNMVLQLLAVSKYAVTRVYFSATRRRSLRVAKIKPTAVITADVRATDFSSASRVSRFVPYLL